MDSTAHAVSHALSAARAAQPAWAGRPLRERLAVVARFRRLVFENRTAIAETISGETGKPIPESLIAEVAPVLDGARFLERIAGRTLATRRTRSATLALWRKSILTHHEPYGVVAVISPWNYPFLFTTMHVLPALVAGNAVLLKPSEHTPASAGLLESLLAAAGLPCDVLQLLQGDGAMGAALVNASVDKVFFTGSARTGRFIAESCAPRFIPVSLELGGSDAAIVLEDADLDIAASGILWGRFTNAGQTCVAVKRVVAVGAAHDALVARLAASVGRLSAGAGGDALKDVGRVITPAQKELIVAQLDDAIARGATVVVRTEPVDDGIDAHAPLAVLTDVTPAMRVWHEETFGPVLAIMRANDPEEALAMANDSIHGLSGSIWTKDRRKGRALARRMESGSVVLNDAVVAAGIPEVAHGGVKGSGIGRVHGVEGLLECVRTHTVVDDILPGTRQPWWFGYGPSSAERIDGYLRLTHGRTLRERLGGIAATLRLIFSPERPL